MAINSNLSLKAQLDVQLVERATKVEIHYFDDKLWAEIYEHNWSVDFLESNVNEERAYNGEGEKLSDEFYSDLYNLFCDDNDVFFASSNDNCIVQTVGKFDSRYSFKLKDDGLHWVEEEEDEELEDVSIFILLLLEIACLNRC